MRFSIAGTGLPMSSQDENCGAILQKLVKDIFSLEIQISDISTAQKLGTKRLNQNADKRHIILKFCR